LIERAEKKDRISDAVQAFQDARKFAEEHGIEGQTKKALEEKIGQLDELDRLSEQADSLEKKEKLDEALQRYEAAQRLAASNGFEVLAAFFKKEIERLIEKISSPNHPGEGEDPGATYRQAIDFLRKLQSGDDSGPSQPGMITPDRWQEAIQLLEHAGKLFQEQGASADKRNELERLLAHARLYQVLALAWQSYKDGNFATAVSEYGNAMDLLNKNRSVFAAIYNNAAAKIRRTSLMIDITIKLTAARAAEKKDDLETALNHYKAIRDLIRSYKGSRDKDILAIEEYIRSRIRELGLKVSFEAIFREAYPASRSSKLSSPQMTLSKEENGLEIYNVTCSERNRGSVYLLQLCCRYNPATSAWARYSGSCSADKK
jgi:tetratricopeptide (TPR) repeat protein